MDILGKNLKNHMQGEFGDILESLKNSGMHPCHSKYTFDPLDEITR